MSNTISERDTEEAAPRVASETKFFQLGHDPEDGFYLEVEQDMDGKLLDSVFAMIEKNFGLQPVDEYENDVVVLDNGSIRIWLESAITPANAYEEDAE